MACAVLRTLALPEIAALRPNLIAEFPVYALRGDETGETGIAGVADALTLDDEGRPQVIVDWKSDVNPDAGMIDHYRVQVAAYLAMTGAERGLIVLMTTGGVLSVTRPAEPMAA